MNQDALTKFVLDKSPANAIELIRTVCMYSPSIDDAITVIERIAAGEDGIAGTGDDVLDKDTLECLKILIRQNAVQDLVEKAYAKGVVGCCFA